MGRPVENEEVVTLRQLLVLKEARLAEAMAEIEQLKRHIAGKPREHTVLPSSVPVDAAYDTHQ
jgi:hypothetical protein